MTNLFRLDASIRTEGSVTREIADVVQAQWTAAHPGGLVIQREVGVSPLPSTLWPISATAGYIPPEARSAEQRAAIAFTAALTDELLAADAYVFAVPLYNFGVAQSFKTWIDVVLTDPRFAPGAASPVAGRPAVLVTARGGGYGPGTPREGWDHATPWMRRILSDKWELDLEVVETELTLADVTPAMEGLRGLAAQLRQESHGHARRHGLALARRVVQAA